MPTPRRRRKRPDAALRRVAIVTGTRAEFGLLEPVLRALQRRRGLDPRLIVTGMHLLRRFGRTADQIRRAGWRIHARVKMQSGEDDARDEPMALARGISGIARALDELGCGTVLVLGDRIEALAGACAASLGRRLLVHIHGGDRAVGDLDDLLRDAITRLADVHLVASRAAADRLRRMGEPASRIYRVGAPGLDDIRSFRDADRKQPGAAEAWLRRALGPLAGRPYAVVLQHPAGHGDREEAAIMRRVITAVERCNLAGVAIYPNCDPGHSGIVRVIEGLRSQTNWRVFRSLDRQDYVRLVSRAAVLVGNSSSGIIESATLGVNTVNVGRRQAGRLRCGSNAVDVADGVASVMQGIRRALKQPRPRPARSVYGDGRAGERIADTLQRLITQAPPKEKKRLAY